MLQVEEIRTVRFKALWEVPFADWEKVQQAYNPFHEQSFLEVMESSGVENAKYDYLIFYQGGEPIATAVLSSFNIDLSLFIGEENWVKWLKRKFPSLFNVRILFCGTPVSIGHTNFHCIASHDACLEALNEVMKNIAQEQKIRLLTLKELSSQERNLFEPSMKKKGWFVGHSLPDTKMKIRWKTYEEYLLNMRAPYRRQVLSALTNVNNGEKSNRENARAILEERINVLSAEEININDFYEKYLCVMDRAEVKLETLNLRFFELLQERFARQLRFFVCHSVKGSACYALCLEQGKNLHFLWTSKKEDKDIRNSYLNQIQAIILYAIKSGIEYLHVGQTAYYPKMRMGAVPEDRYLFFQSLNPLVNPVLRSLRKVIFPNIILQNVQPFKKQLKENRIAVSFESITEGTNNPI